MTPDGTKLLSVHTGNNSLEAHAITHTGIVHSGSIPVRSHPATVRARNNNEAWVVCQPSDEVSIVERSAFRGLLQFLHALHQTIEIAEVDISLAVLGDLESG